MSDPAQPNPAQTEKVAGLLVIDAGYLARVVERFRDAGEVRIPLTAARTILTNLEAAIETLNRSEPPQPNTPPEGGTTPVTVVSPAVQAFADAQAQATKKMEAATQEMLSLLTGSKPNTQNPTTAEATPS